MFKIWYEIKYFNEDLKIVAQTYKFCDEDIKNFVWCQENKFIFMSTGITGRDLMKQNYQEKNNFTVS